MLKSSFECTDLLPRVPVRTPAIASPTAPRCNNFGMAQMMELVGGHSPCAAGSLPWDKQWGRDRPDHRDGGSEQQRQCDRLFQ